jgi:hypothetical protein
MQTHIIDGDYTNSARGIKSMKTAWEANNCAAMKAHFEIFSIPRAAALWCGVPEEQVGKVIEEAKQLATTGLGRSIWTHHKIPCIEPRSRAIAEAIEDGSLPHGREDARPVANNDHVAYERRHVFGRDLKKWMEKAFPNEKPAFLFDDIERHTHAAINTDTYLVLMADRDALVTQLEDLKTERQRLLHEKEELTQVNQSLVAMTENMRVPSERSETTYLNIIGAMMDLMLGHSPGGRPYSVFSSQAAIIDALLAHHEGKTGIATRTLEGKFAKARESLGARV